MLVRAPSGGEYSGLHCAPLNSAATGNTKTSPISHGSVREDNRSSGSPACLTFLHHYRQHPEEQQLTRTSEKPKQSRGTEHHQHCREEEEAEDYSNLDKKSHDHCLSETFFCWLSELLRLQNISAAARLQPESTHFLVSMFSHETGRQTSSQLPWGGPASVSCLG